jgi:hypothetical protein
MRDSNVLRTQTDERSDNIARLGGGMTIDQRVAGRQRCASTRARDYYKYDKSSTLDHWAYALAGDWLWEIGNNLSGELLAGYDRRQWTWARRWRTARSRHHEARCRHRSVPDQPALPHPRGVDGTTPTASKIARPTCAPSGGRWAPIT